jgi:hypothetical protein
LRGKASFSSWTGKAANFRLNLPENGKQDCARRHCQGRAAPPAGLRRGTSPGRRAYLRWIPALLKLPQAWLLGRGDGSAEQVRPFGGGQPAKGLHSRPFSNHKFFFSFGTCRVNTSESSRIGGACRKRQVFSLLRTAARRAGTREGAAPWACWPGRRRNRRRRAQALPHIASSQEKDKAPQARAGALGFQERRLLPRQGAAGARGGA